MISIFYSIFPVLLNSWVTSANQMMVISRCFLCKFLKGQTDFLYFHISCSLEHGCNNHLHSIAIHSMNVPTFSKCLFLLLLLLKFYFYFFSFIFISCRLITLQYCSGFCHTLTWISHGFTCVSHPDPPSHLPLHPIPLGLPSAPAPSTCLMHPTWAGDLFHPV